MLARGPLFPLPSLPPAGAKAKTELGVRLYFFIFAVASGVLMTSCAVAPDRRDEAQDGTSQPQLPNWEGDKGPTACSDRQVVLPSAGYHELLTSPACAPPRSGSG